MLFGRAWASRISLRAIDRGVAADSDFQTAGGEKSSKGAIGMNRSSAQCEVWIVLRRGRSRGIDASVVNVVMVGSG